MPTWARIRRIALAAYLALLAALLLAPGGSAPSPGGNMGHLWGFAVLAALLGWATRLSLPMVLMLSILIGSLTELLQAQIPGRTPELADLILDGLGSMMGVALVAAFDDVVR